MNTIKDQIIEAMKHLGIKGTVTITPAGFRRYKVSLDGEYFGMFDIDRNTFVD